MAKHELRGLARDQIVTAWKPNTGNLQTAPSHPDYFGANLAEYTEALSDIDLDWAITEFDNWRNSLYPSGFAPHYLSKPHPRGIGPLKIDTSWVDRRVLGTTELPNGEHVSDKAAPPNWATASKTIADKIKDNSSYRDAAEFIEEYFGPLCDSSLALYQERVSDEGLLRQTHKDELTLRDGILADELDTKKSVNDPYNQALLYKNEASLKSLANEYGLAIPATLQALMHSSSAHMERYTATPDGVAIENLLARLTIANQLEIPSQHVADLMADFSHLRKFRNGVPTYANGSGDYLQAVNETDKGNVNHALSLKAGSLLIELSRKAYVDDHERFRIFVLGATIIQDSINIIDSYGFVRQSSPSGNNLNTERTGLGQKISRSQPVWTPTAVAIYNTPSELFK